MKAARLCVFIDPDSEIRVQPSLLDCEAYLQGEDVSIVLRGLDGWKSLHVAMEQARRVLEDAEMEREEAAFQAMNNAVNEG